MSLESTYSTIKQTPITRLSVCGSAPIIERDPRLRELEHSVSRQIAALASDDVQNIASSIVHDVKHVSVEDALKELIALKAL